MSLKKYNLYNLGLQLGEISIIPLNGNLEERNRTFVIEQIRLNDVTAGLCFLNLRKIYGRIKETVDFYILNTFSHTSR